jgi:hypothetical protein
MSRFVRHLGRLICAGSLLLFLAVCVLWIRSHFVTDRIRLRSASGARAFYSRQGNVVFYMLRADWSKQPASALGLDYQRDEPGPASNELSVRHFLCCDSGASEVFWQHGSFAWWDRHRSDGVLYLMAVAPFWSLAVALVILPAVWGGLRIRGRFAKGRAGLCRDCGYDLRATPLRCPECGLVAGG